MSIQWKMMKIKYSLFTKKERTQLFKTFQDLQVLNIKKIVICKNKLLMRQLELLKNRSRIIYSTEKL